AAVVLRAAPVALAHVAGLGLAAIEGPLAGVFPAVAPGGSTAPGAPLALAALARATSILHLRAAEERRAREGGEAEERDEDAKREVRHLGSLRTARGVPIGTHCNALNSGGRVCHSCHRCAIAVARHHRSGESNPGYHFPGGRAQFSCVGQPKTA